jgi:hypothetical protein
MSLFSPGQENEDILHATLPGNESEFALPFASSVSNVFQVQRTTERHYD